MDYEKLRQRIRDLAQAGDRAGLEAYEFPQGSGREWLEFVASGRIPFCDRGRSPQELARLLAEFTKREYPFEIALDALGARVLDLEACTLERRVDLFVAAILLRREERRLPNRQNVEPDAERRLPNRQHELGKGESRVETRRSTEVHALDLRGAHKEVKRGHLRMGGVNPRGDRLDVTSYYLEWNGAPIVPAMGEFAFSRYPALEWDEELLKMRMGGISIVSSYLFWIHHEEDEGVFDWSGQRDIRRFVELCQKQGLWVLLRIGPFAHGECRNGGLPDWLYGRPFKVRSNDPGYLACVERYYGEMGRQLQGLMFQQGGPIIAIQLDNEFMNTGAPWELAYKKEMHYFNSGSGGVAHMRNLRRLAQQAGMDAPIFSATSWGSPIIENEMLPVWGGCGFVYKDWHADPQAEHSVVRAFQLGDYPFVTHEMTSGMLSFYSYRPSLIYLPEHTTSANSVALGCGSNWLGTYTYHGGTNPIGKHAYLNEWTVPRLSYDFQAPIREFGQTLASYRTMKTLYTFMTDFGAHLAPTGTLLPAGQASIRPEDTATLRWCVRANGSQGYVFLNNYQDRVDTGDHQDVMRPNIGIIAPSGELSEEERLHLEALDEQMDMRAHSVQFRLQTDGGDLCLPRAGGINVQRSVSAILPFNLPLGDVTLKYATAQPFARLHTEAGEHYFFFAPDGMAPEYCFDPATVLRVEGGAAPAQRFSEGWVATPNPGFAPPLVVSAMDGSQVRISTLTRQQADDCWKVVLWGRERLVHAPAGVLVGDGWLDLYRTGSPELSFGVYPAPEGELHGPFGALRGQQDGILTRYALSAAPVEPPVQVNLVRVDKAVLSFGAGLLDGVSDVFLRIRYAGDNLNAFIDGRLVSDHFCNGTPWEIGLKRFYPEVVEKGMYLYVAPLQKGSDVEKSLGKQLARAYGREFTDEETAEILSIEAVPEYRARVTRRA